MDIRKYSRNAKREQMFIFRQVQKSLFKTARLNKIVIYRRHGIELYQSRDTWLLTLLLKIMLDIDFDSCPRGTAMRKSLQHVVAAWAAHSPRGDQRMEVGTNTNRDVLAHYCDVWLPLPAVTRCRPREVLDRPFPRAVLVGTFIGSVIAGNNRIDRFCRFVPADSYVTWYAGIPYSVKSARAVKSELASKAAPFRLCTSLWITLFNAPSISVLPFPPPHTRCIDPPTMLPYSD